MKVMTTTPIEDNSTSKITVIEEVDLVEVPLFTQYVYRGNVAPSHDLKDFILAHKKTIESEGVQKSNRGGWQSPVYNIESHPVLTPYLVGISKQVAELFNLYGIPNDLTFEDITYWININNKGDFNMPHIHPGSVFSAVWYVEAPENCGNLQIERLDKEFIHWNLAEAKTPRTAEIYTVEPKNGEIVIFPSTMTHWVEPSQTDSERISIAINFSSSRNNLNLLEEKFTTKINEEE